MSTEKPQAALITVTGRVQRVGYRRYILDIAQEIGISGYIKNMDDGSVKIFCQAPPTILQQFIEKARNPPPPAQIKQFEIKETKPRPELKIFKIRYGPIQEELQEGFGAMQSIFMEYWRE
ncbi:MAG: acylphosphatase, partial [Thaumarchaeota archaeon]|nr:acylphosphatase [Candidatus Geocrenenecus arthurdayi]